jgi:hypothetical protein
LNDVPTAVVAASRGGTAILDFATDLLANVDRTDRLEGTTRRQIDTVPVGWCQLHFALNVGD